MTPLDFGSGFLRSLAGGVAKIVGARAAPLAAQAPAAVEGITAAGLTAFVNFVAPLVRIVEGKGTLADDEAAANAAMDAIALLDPAAAPIIAMIEAAEPAFAALVGLAKTQGFTITGGYPDIVGMENDRNFKNR